jgi:hypothetical protein
MRRLLSTRRMSAIAVACFLAGSGYVAPRRVEACLPPPAFSDYIQESDAIVVGRALAIKEVTVGPEEDQSVDQRAVLRSDTFLKKDVEVAPLIECSVSTNVAQMLSSSPDVPALVFLEFNEDTQELMGIEARVLADFSVERVFVARVREMIDLLAITDERARHQKYLEWCIRCIEEEPTRNDGLESMPSAAWRSAGEGSDDDGNDVWRTPLSDSQWDRIMAVYFDGSDDEALDESMHWVISLLGERRDPRLIAYLERELLQNADSPENAAPLMYLLADTLDWKTGNAIVSRFQASSIEEQQNLIAEYLRLLPARVEYPSEPEEVEEIAEENETIDAPEVADEVPNDDEAVDEELPAEEP